MPSELKNCVTITDDAAGDDSFPPSAAAAAAGGVAVVEAMPQTARIVPCGFHEIQVTGMPVSTRYGLLSLTLCISCMRPVL
ncbi:hypothetical protein DQ04_14471010 [Trypanosoma grayi]|uniref:hypothetical protein n=1 Tax=Trypanosoma grayi TaxID=71804 RepID=UPI0004F40962|nr:hypothetical protein DQ04_14471010 [Trypanosoma grayi]KEG06351.1 hypothetical protein DQ04_14471010 [Trypanosoma grayi]